MAIDSQVSIFSQMMKTRFLTAFEATAKPAPYEKYTEIVPSDQRIEHYPWMTPSPGIARYVGHRRYGKIDVVKYSVENLEFDAGFEVLLRDIEDDLVGGYMRKPPELAERAKKFPGRWVVKHLSAGTTRTGFDGSAFFANTHSLGTGDNLLTKNCASNDGITHKLVALFTGGPLKPLLWQARKPPRFETNAGTPPSKEAKIVRYWIDMEGEAAYGFWWNAIHMTITDTPNLVEMHEIFSQIEVAFRGFQLPKAAESEDGEYVYEQEVFSTENLHLVGTTGLADLLRTSLNESWLPVNVGSNTAANTNRFRGWADWSVSALLT